MKFLARLLGITIAIFFLSSAHAETVNVFAAASMKTAIDQIGQAWKTQAHKNMVATYGSSATLAKQIEQAAPADIFISADLDWMDYLVGKNLIKTESRKNLASNSLVVIAAKGSRLAVKLESAPNITEILGDEKLALGEIKSVPAGKYAKTAFDKLGLWRTVESRVVMQDNVRSALALVARGEAKLGVVYGSDAASESKVEVVATFPETSHAPIIYPAAVIASSSNPDADIFLDFLTSQDARLIFKENGFMLQP
jgi:molybdate transport system substrate-binding protein